MSRKDSTTTFASLNEQLMEDFRAHGGEATSGPFVGRPLLILTTVGARSGEARENPLVYTRDGERYVVIASKGGAPTHPSWYHNLVANPEPTIEVGAETFQAKATVAEGDERNRLFAAQAALMPNFAEYQRKTSRQIPVVVLERVQS